MFLALIYDLIVKDNNKNKNFLRTCKTFFLLFMRPASPFVYFAGVGRDLRRSEKRGDFRISP